jgi:hypothetical protein
MSLEALTCPSCGAPATSISRARATDGLWPCLHCGAILRIKGDDPIVVEKQVSPDISAQIRQLVVDGKTAQARQLAVERGLDASIVDPLALELMTGVLFSQKMNPLGCVIVLVANAIATGGILLVANGFAWGWALFVVGLLAWLPLVRSVWTTIRMATLPSGRAYVRRVTVIGVRQLPKPVHIMAFEVAVTPNDGTAAFAGSMLVPVREESVEKAVEGAQIIVRFDPNDRSWLRFDRMA